VAGGVFHVMTYSDKLKDPKWQRKRLEVLQRDNFTCLACGANDRQLHVHHCYYVSEREPWEYGQRALKTLCDDCHELAHLDAVSAKTSERRFVRWCEVNEICEQFEILDRWVSDEFYSGLTKSGRFSDPADLIVCTAHFLSEDPNRETGNKGSMTDPKLKTARIAIFHRAGAAGVFTDEFMRELEAKTVEMEARWKAEKEAANA